MTNTFNNYDTNVTSKQVSTYHTIMLLTLFSMFCITFMAGAYAVDLTALANLTDAENPLKAALKSVTAMTAGAKALVVVIAFLVALVGASMLKNAGIIVQFIGVAIFAAIGLPIGFAIAGYVV